jgi:hypothetical protein
MTLEEPEELASVDPLAAASDVARKTAAILPVICLVGRARPRQP